MHKVLVVGISGAGKTTAARRLAELIHAPFHELDALAIGPGWSTPTDLVANVERILAGPAWVFDSYGRDQVREAMWAAADTVVWLDYPARIVLPRIVRRSLARSIKRTPVFGGNIETWRSWLSWEHPVWWAARQSSARRRAILALTQQPAFGHLHVVRLTNPRQFDRWFTSLSPEGQARKP